MASSDTGPDPLDNAANSTDTAVPPWLQGPPPDPNDFNGQSIVPVAIVTSIIATSLVALRFYTRIRVLRAIHWEDWFILGALLLGLATSSIMIAQLGFGLGQHFYYVWPLAGDYIKSGIFSAVTYFGSLYCTKISILCLYIRIFTYQSAQLSSKILLGFVVVSHSWILASVLTTCVPLDSLWVISKVPTYCHHFSVHWVNAGLNMFSDVLIFLLPLPVIISLRLPKKQRFALSFIFLLGFAVCAISAVRLFKLVYNGNQSPEEAMDITWTSVSIANLNSIEVHTAITCACLTTLKPLVAWMFPGLISSNPYGSPNQNQGSSTGGNGYRPPLTIGRRRTLHPEIRRASSSSSFGGPEPKGQVSVDESAYGQLESQIPSSREPNPIILIHTKTNSKGERNVWPLEDMSPVKDQQQLPQYARGRPRVGRNGDSSDLDINILPLQIPGSTSRASSSTPSWPLPIQSPSPSDSTHEWSPRGESLQSDSTWRRTHDGEEDERGLGVPDRACRRGGHHLRSSFESLERYATSEVSGRRMV